MLKKYMLLNFKSFLLAVVMLSTALTTSAFAQTRACVQLFDETRFEKIEPDLYGHYLNEIQGLNTEQINQLNTDTLKKINDYVPIQQTHRAQTITWQDGVKLLKATYNHPVVGFDQVEKYSRGTEEMGFCFGRAMYIHLTLLKMGLQKESIQKIWAVGPMSSTSSPGVAWGYHVATIAFSKEAGWIALDTNLSQPLTIETWINTYSQLSRDQKLRFYITEANKQALYTGQYSRYLLGLNLNREDDWFKNYFVDMLAAIRTESLESLGLQKLSIESRSIKSSQTKNRAQIIFEKVKEFFLY